MADVESGPQWTPQRTLAVMAAAVGLVLLLVWISGSGGGDDGGSTAVVTSQQVTRQVVYKLTGTAAGADLTFTDGHGQTTQAMGKAVPLVRKDGEEGFAFEAEPGVMLYFSAQNTGSAGLLTCQIVVDGAVVAENTSDGGYAIVTCQA